jgi:hypothetical protein
VFAFLVEAEGRTFPQAVEEIATFAGVSLSDGHVNSTPRPTPVETRRISQEELRQEVLEQRRKAVRLWMRSQQPIGTIAETYLHARGYYGRIPATIRYLPASGAYTPALVAAYGMATEPEPGLLEIHDKDVVGVHRIKLLPDGSDRLRGDPKCKITIGKGIGSPIILAPPNDGLGLTIAEGIEDALIAHQETGLGAWAAGGAARLPILADAIPSYIEAVTVLVDDNEAGRIHSRELASRIHCQARFERTEILMMTLDTAP